MKNKIAASLSLAGVLVAGSAAALVNTQVLKGASASAPKTPTIAGQAATFGATVVDDNIATVAEASATSVVSIEVPESTVPAPTVAPATASAAAGTGASDTSTQVEYTVGSAGVVTLDTVGDRLTIISTTPAAGWKLVKAEQEDPHAVDIRFRSATAEVTFRAHLLFGVISTSVAASNLDTSGKPVVTTPGTTPATIEGGDDTSSNSSNTGNSSGNGSSSHHDDKGGDSGHDDQHDGGESDD